MKNRIVVRYAALAAAFVMIVLVPMSASAYTAVIKYPKKPQLYVLSPTHDDGLRAGDTFTIKWTIPRGRDGYPEAFDIWLIDQKTGRGAPIASNRMTEFGRYDWRVEPLSSTTVGTQKNPIEPSGKYLIKVACHYKGQCRSTVSDDYFVITQ